MDTIKVGDTVFWGKSLGRPPVPAKITAIDLCSRPGVKYGVPVKSVPRNLLSSCCVSLDNGHWGYGDQITPMEKN